MLESIVGKDFLPRGSGNIWHSYSWMCLFALIFLVEYLKINGANYM